MATWISMHWGVIVAVVSLCCLGLAAFLVLGGYNLGCALTGEGDDDITTGPDYQIDDVDEAN